MIFEHRIYQALPGKLDVVQARFLDHTLRFFARHAIEVTGIFRREGSDTELHYLTQFPSVEKKDSAWAAFQADPEWQAVKADSEKAGPLLASQTVTLLHPVDTPTY